MTPDEITANADALADRFEHDYTPTVDTSTPEEQERRRPHACPNCGLTCHLCVEPCWADMNRKCFRCGHLLARHFR
jgi:hypothetical protein